jgi:SPP1 gp7 family putative phage head morphogenesis protein
VTAGGGTGNTDEPGPPPAAVPGRDASRTNGGSQRDDGSAAQSWPGWFSDSQLAAEYARTLTAALTAAVNAGNLARQWLELNAAHRHPPADTSPGRRGTGQQAFRPAPLAWPAQKAQEPEPRQFLARSGVTAALAAALSGVLDALHAAAWAVGWASASAVAGLGEIIADAALADRMLAEGRKTRAGWILRTMVRRLEKLLMRALRDGTGEDELARRITDLLGSLTKALLITRSETTWAIGQATLGAYVKAGIAYKKWQTRDDSLVCHACLANQAAGSIPVMAKFPSGDLAPLLHPNCRCVLLPGSRPSQSSMAGKSGQTAAEVLREYWTRQGHPGPTGWAGEEKIRWGQSGDWQRCCDELAPHIGAEGAKGYCNLRHHEVLGYWPAQHAKKDAGD